MRSECDGWKEVPSKEKGDIVVATIRGPPLTEAYLNPFSTFESDTADADAPEPQRRLDAAASSSAASPSTYFGRLPDTCYKRWHTKGS